MAAVPAVLVQVADAVVALLNTPNTFSQKFTAKTNYPSIKTPLTELGTLRVDVIPQSYSRIYLETQGSVEFDCRIAIAIRKKFGDTARVEQTAEGRPVDNSEVHALVLLYQEFCLFLKKQPRISNVLAIDAANDANDGIEPTDTYIVRHLQDFNQFTGIIQATYTASVDLA